MTAAARASSPGPAPAPTAPPTVLAEAEWVPRAAAYRARVDALVVPHRERRRTGRSHPVLDFLFTYYAETPGRLRRWHPGAGVLLTGRAARERLDWPSYAGVAVPGPDGDEVRGVGLDLQGFLTRRGDGVARTADLLRATASRPPSFGCFGLHEWAMVYRPADGEVRHDAIPLRLGTDGTAAVVDAARVRCTHHDAFRFFSAAARPLNALQPTRERQVELEQPGCLHATMDLYKWAYKAAPAVPGELLADCLELAVQVRELDMRASPYDLTAHGYAPVEIETLHGRAEYVAAQRSFAERGAVLRARLLTVLEDVLARAGRTVGA